MKVEKTSIFTGKTHEMDLDITQEQLDRYENGNEKIQDVFPHLNADEREFLMTGTGPGEWDELVPPAEEEGQ